MLLKNAYLDTVFAHETWNVELTFKLPCQTFGNKIRKSGNILDIFFLKMIVNVGSDDRAKKKNSHLKLNISLYKMLNIYYFI